jgi:hypothetical protein
MRFFRRRDDIPEDDAAREEIERAYQRGREDEARRHRSHPILAILVFAAAALGAGMIYLAAHEGSFTRGGQVVDQKLASAADTAHSASQTAAAATVNAGQDVQSAGQTLRQDSAAR